MSGVASGREHPIVQICFASSASVHCCVSQKGKPRDEKLDARRNERHILGQCWRTGEVAIGGEEGIRRVASRCRVGAHRRWDAEGLSKIRRRPWDWNPDEGVDSGDELEPFRIVSHDARIHRLALRKEDFVAHGFTEQCAGCQGVAQLDFAAVPRGGA